MEKTADNKPTYDELLAKNAELEFEVLHLKEELAQLRRLIFGQKRERFVPVHNDSQLAFGLDIEAKQDAPVEEQVIVYKRQKQKKNHTPHSRNPLPAHLPRKDTIIEPQEDVSGLKKIGEEITEELEYKPSTFYVNRYIRPKYARPRDEGIAIGLLPSRPIEKGIAGPGLLAHIAISKFVDHLPLYRQIQQFKRQGVELAESTLCGWVEATCNLLLPLYRVQRDLVLQACYLQVDETTIKVLDLLKKGTTHTGYYWVYYDPVAKQVLFDYRKSRGRDGPNRMLQDFEGHLQTDGYTVYDEITARPHITGVGCFGHGRRKFIEAQPNDAERAEWMLSAIQKLYRIERHAREAGMSFDERYRLRQQYALPVLREIKTWLNQQLPTILPKSAIGKAVGYMLGQWPKLEKYVTDGRLEIDNNLIENAIRPVALGRKNYLFAGSHEGAKRAAVIYTMVANAKLHGVEPFVYLKDVLSRIADYPYKQLADLLPPNWTKNAPQT